MKFPGRNQRGEDAYSGIVHGEQIKADGGRHGVVDDGNVAWPERVAEARRSWTQARAEDFQQTGKRRFVDRATGLEYRSLPGCPLLSVGSEVTRGVSCFLVQGQRLVFLRRADYPEELLGATGHVHGQVLSAASPGPEGPRIL